MTDNIVNDIMNMKFRDILNMPIGEDEIHLIKVPAPSIPNSFTGAGASATIPDNSSKKRRMLREQIQFKENFPKMLISEFGASFFFNELKIPKENYLHFLEYCNTLNIEQLYKDDKKIDVIKILQEESKGYLKIINLRE